MTETQMQLLCHWLLIGGLWFMLIYYGFATMSAVAYDQRIERRNHLPTRPARLLVVTVQGETVGVRPWWRVHVNLAMVHRVQEHYARLQ